MGRIDRLQELNKLLEKLRKYNPNNYSDIDLILTYLEELINNPSISKGSKKLLEFEIKPDNNTMSRLYNVTWRKFDNEEY